RADQDSAVRHSFGTEPLTGKLELDFSFSLALSSDSDDNIFDLSVFPYVPSQSEKVAIFASPNLLTNKTAIYFLAIEVQAQESWEFFPLQARDDYPYQDNSNCLEGATRQTASAYNPILSSDNEGLEQNQSVSCATIDLGSGGPPGGGMASFLAGICLSAFFVALRGRRDDFFV
ncbi:MAG: hypothetical protein WEB87_00025, partial [Bacteriovoracaceae bacterium]